MLTTNNYKYHRLQTAILLLSMPISGLAIDIYVPSLPTICKLFYVSMALGQRTISYYLLGYALIQFCAGNISDVIGRRFPYLWGITLFIISSLSITLTNHNIYYLITLRFLQGISAGLIVVPVRAIFADLYSGAEYYKYGNYVTLAWAIGPIIAPALGGYLHYFFGWQACFYFLSGYSAILLIGFFYFIPETRKIKYQITFYQSVYKYKIFFLSPEFVAGVILQGLLYSIFILFSVVGPFLIQDRLHYSVVSFGHFALLMGVAWFSGNLLNRCLINIDLQKKVALVLALMFFTCVLSVLVNFYFKLNIYLVITTTAVLLFFASIIYPNLFAKNTKIFPNLSGSSSAVAGGGCFLISAMIGYFGDKLKIKSSLPLTESYLLITLMLLLAYIIQYYYAEKTATS